MSFASLELLKQSYMAPSCIYRLHSDPRQYSLRAEQPKTAGANE